MKQITRDVMLKLPEGIVFCVFDPRTATMSPLAIRGGNAEGLQAPNDFFYRPVGAPHPDLTFGDLPNMAYDPSQAIRDHDDGVERLYYILNSEELDSAIQALHLAGLKCRYGTPRHKVEKPAIHIDEWLDRSPFFFNDDDRILNYVHFFFMYKRFAASYKLAYKPFMSQFKLFVTYEGKRYRVTGASRMGDIWLSSDFNEDTSYDKGPNGRVAFDLTKLTNWSPHADVDSAVTAEELKALMGEDPS